MRLFTMHMTCHFHLMFGNQVVPFVVIPLVPFTTAEPAYLSHFDRWRALWQDYNSILISTFICIHIFVEFLKLAFIQCRATRKKERKKIIIAVSIKKEFHWVLFGECWNDSRWNAATKSFICLKTWSVYPRTFSILELYYGFSICTRFFLHFILFNAEISDWIWKKKQKSQSAYILLCFQERQIQWIDYCGEKSFLNNNWKAENLERKNEERIIKKWHSKIDWRQEDDAEKETKTV